MKVLKEGTAHRRDKHICECKFCESKIQIWESDPLSYRKWNGHDGIQYELTFKCPVCGSMSTVKTHHSHCYDGLEIEEKALLSKEDKEEISNFENFSTKNLTNDEMDQLHIYKYTSDDPRFSEYI